MAALEFPFDTQAFSLVDRLSADFDASKVFKIAQTFLERLDPGCEVFEFRTFDDDTRRGAKSLISTRRGTLAAKWRTLQSINETGAGIFVTVNDTDGRGVKAENITRLRAVWQDDDGGGVVDNFPLPPSMVVRTSTGKAHRYWFADALTPEQFKGVMACMVANYGSDAGVIDTARVLRLPGTVHMKASPELVTIEDDTGARYTGEELAAAFPAPAEPERPPASNVVPMRPPGSSTPIFPNSRRADIESALPFIPADARDTWYKVGMALKAEFGEAGRGLWDDWSKASGKFNARDQERVWRSFRRDGVAGNSIIYLAAQEGWKATREPINSAEADAYTLGAFGPKAAPAAAEKKRRFEIIPFEDIKLDLTPRYLIRDVLPRSGLAVIWGPPKEGKTFWAFDLCMHVALGRDYRGKRAKRGIVVYGCFEGINGFKARKAAFERERMAGHAGGVPFFLQPIAPDLIKEHPALIQAMRDALGDDTPAIVVLDTLARSLIGSESDGKDMAAYIAAADAIRLAFDCCVIIVHHCGHDASRLRGHSSLIGALDAEISVTKAGEVITSKVELMKDGRAGTEFYSTLQEVNLGKDTDGEDITSCVISEAERPAEGEGAGKAKGRPNAASQIALASLTREILERGADMDIDGGKRRVVAIDAWRGQAYSDGIATGTQDAKRQAFGRAFQALVAAKKVRVSEPYCWLESGAADGDVMAENLLKN
jgi:hypothetical protein